MKRSDSARCILLVLAALLLTGCAAPVVTGPIFQGQTAASTAPATAMPAASADRLLFIGDDGNLYTALADGTDQTALTNDASRSRVYSQPTWTPDGKRIAWTRIDEGSNGFAVIARSDGRIEAEVAVPAPPFFYAWNPDGDRLAYLSNWSAPAGQTLALRLVDLTSDQPTVRTIATGQPLYFSWAPTGDFLLTHTGNAQVGISSMQARSTVLAQNSADFAAPQWLTDPARFAYAVMNEGEQQIVIGNLRSGQVETLAYFKGTLSFSFSPDGKKLAYTESEDGQGMNAFGPLLLLDVPSGEFRQLSEGPIVAFFWSPNGGSLYFMKAIVQGGTFGLQLAVWNGTERVDLGIYQPSNTLLNQYLRFADQYGQSASYWSPDSSSVLFTGRNPEGVTGIWSIPVDGGPTTRIGRGVYAAWPGP